MQSFVEQPGVPLVTFGDGQPMGMPVAQTRFYLAGEDADEREAGTVSAGWTMPVCVKTSGKKGGALCSLVTKDSAALAVPEAPAVFLCQCGRQGVLPGGVFAGEVKAITAAAETGLSVPERIGFLGDRWALTRAGEGSVGDYLDLVLALKGDTHAHVLDAALSTVDQIRTKVATEEERKALNAVIREQFGPVYAALGADSKKESYDEKEIRTELLRGAGQRGGSGGAGACAGGGAEPV